jgi:hypothetical protein
MRINPNSAIRSGYTFEDFFALKLFYDWLKEPNLYKTVRIQYIPDELDTNKFYLDDIVAVDKNDFYHCYQLKHKQNPSTDAWTFESFLEKGKKREALIEKWISSHSLIPKGRGLGYFVTNGLADNKIGLCLTGTKLDVKKIETSFPEFYKQLLDFSSNANELSSFLNTFSFCFNYPDKEEFERNLRSAYYNDLKVTKAGFDNLLLSIYREGSEKNPTEFTIDGIKKILEWYNPRPLKQNFEVPQDFELYDNKKHGDLLKELSKASGGIKVIVGKPGVGKSTYLSNLHTFLTESKKTLSIRHHYHLNPKDSSYYERLNAIRAIEALKAEFRKLSDDVLGDFANHNLRHTPLNEIINRVAQYHYSLGKAFVLIIDGLDHVIRERKSEKELLSFLDEILVPQNGLWIILGTQELAVEYFQNAVHTLGTAGKKFDLQMNPLILSVFEFEGSKQAVIKRLATNPKFAPVSNFFFFASLEEVKENCAAAWKDIHNNILNFS